MILLVKSLDIFITINKAHFWIDLINGLPNNIKKIIYDLFEVWG